MYIVQTWPSACGDEGRGVLTLRHQCSCLRCSSELGSSVHVFPSTVSSVYLLLYWESCGPYEGSTRPLKRPPRVSPWKAESVPRWTTWNMTDLPYAGLRQGPDWLPNKFPRIGLHMFPVECSGGRTLLPDTSKSLSALSLCKHNVASSWVLLEKWMLPWLSLLLSRKLWVLSTSV